MTSGTEAGTTSGGAGGAGERELLPAEEVRAAFRMILGREPESEAALEHHRRCAGLEELRRALLESREFATFYARISAERIAQRRPTPDQAALDADKHADERPGTVPMLLARGILPQMGPVETEAEPADRARLWDRVAASWAEIGRTAPHWSVLTHEDFRPERLEANRAAFEASAEVEGVLVDAALERGDGSDPAALRCLEIGCGVGRATRALAARFSHVTGVDISPGHLAVAGRELAAAGHENVTLRRVARVEDYARLGPQDFVFSRLVLQHNPPPVQSAILRAVFADLAPGGLALFQLVTYGRHYAYSVAEDLKAGPGTMEMHVFPQPALFALLEACGMDPLELQEDFAAGRDGPYRSHLVLARKRSKPR